MSTLPNLPKPTASELEMLRLLYALGPSTAKQVHTVAMESRPDMNYATVLRLLQVMHTKGLLQRDESARAHIYSPVQAQESVQTSLLKDLIQKAFAGSGKALVLAALRGGHVTQQERAEIQALLDDKPEPPR